MVNDADFSNIVEQRVKHFADQYKSVLISKEDSYLTKRRHKISNFCLIPHLDKSKGINETIQKQQYQYINIAENIIVEVQPIVVGPVYHTSGISEILHIIMEPSLAMILHILKDSFDFKNRLDKLCPNGTKLSTCDIKSLFTNIRFDIFYTTVKYWIEKLQNNSPLLRRFDKIFILEVLSIILEFNYFYINGIYIH